jgi:hypothetical protein
VKSETCTGQMGSNSGPNWVRHSGPMITPQCCDACHDLYSGTQGVPGSDRQLLASPAWVGRCSQCSSVDLYSQRIGWRCLSACMFYGWCIVKPDSGTTSAALDIDLTVIHTHTQNTMVLLSWCAPVIPRCCHGAVCSVGLAHQATVYDL